MFFENSNSPSAPKRITWAFCPSQTIRLTRLRTAARFCSPLMESIPFLKVPNSCFKTSNSILLNACSAVRLSCSSIRCCTFSILLFNWSICVSRACLVAGCTASAGCQLKPLPFFLNRPFPCAACLAAAPGLSGFQNTPLCFFQAA